MIELIYPHEPAPLEKGSHSTRASEMLPIVLPNGEVVAQASRSWCHGNTRPLHPVVHLHIINRDGCIYLQKRAATKKLLPNRWDTAVGGHVSYGEYIQEALFREADEELSFHDFHPVLIDTYINETDLERELAFVFATVGNFELTPDNYEVSAGSYWSVGEIESSLGRGVFTPVFEAEYARYKDILQSLL